MHETQISRAKPSACDRVLRPKKESCLLGSGREGEGSLGGEEGGREGGRIQGATLRINGYASHPGLAKSAF